MFGTRKELEKLYIRISELEMEKCFDPVNGIDFIKLESNHTLKNMQSLLKNVLESKEKNEEKLVAPLIHFFAYRCSQFQKTDVIGPHTPHSPINRICVRLANILAQVMHQHAYKILMPSLRETDFHELQLHQFIIGDDDRVIRVYETLALEKNESFPERGKQKVLFSQESPGVFRQLTLGEETRLKNHSDIVKKYCQKLSGSTQGSLTDKKDLYKALKSKENGKHYCVKASYGKEGEQRLKKQLLPDAQALADIMIDTIPKREWNDFLDAFSSEELCAIILEKECGKLKSQYKNNPEGFEKALLEMADKELNQLVQKDLKLIYTEEQVRARLLCLNHLYGRIRKAAPETTSNVKYYATRFIPSSLSGSYSKDEKLSSTTVQNNFYMNTHPLHDFENYLHERNLHTTHWGPLSNSPHPYLYGVSTLVKLTQITIAAGKKLVEIKKPEEIETPASMAPQSPKLGRPY